MENILENAWWWIRENPWWALIIVSGLGYWFKDVLKIWVSRGKS